ncbi:hypothetical protein JJE72_15825 [Sinomonas sp. JC656]|uniref:CHAT domain-containing protein n=2 Tax=Sinomonas cellulolyticus TaxID=2801916 RepID=A0ABS1K5L2_9MICC|nr:CHAT domain-containing protein [Sinomonas sp. KCTC 49339]MBL0706964.1 hypothetical protein [Sinomonas cellulolyticus]
MSGTGPTEVLFRMADSGSTYAYWRWLDDPDNPQHTVLTPDTVAQAQDLIASAMVDRIDGDGPDRFDPTRRALRDGPLSNPAREAAWSAELAQRLLPPGLAQDLDRRSCAGEDIVLRIIPSPRLARVPWDLLPLPSGRRILEAATVRLDAPAVVNANRGRYPEPWDPQTPDRPLYLLEPPNRPGRHNGNEVIASAAQDLLIERLEHHGAVPGVELGRTTLGRLLRGEPTDKDTAEATGFTAGELPTRLLYYGHADSTPHEPGSAAIHLTDDAAVYGQASPVNGHRPFTALDLLRGTMDAYRRDGDGLDYPGPDETPGHAIWPIPSRAALIGCESGADHRALETFGMVIALLNAGAETVTSTRWTLPTDSAFHDACGTVEMVTTEAVLAVDTAHTGPDPIRAIRDWQLRRLRDWTSGDGRADSNPLVWAALTTHHAPTPAPLTEEEIQAAKAAYAPT